MLLRQLCTEIGVHTIPQCIDGIWIVPLYSWYHASFDAEPDIPGAIPAHKVRALLDMMSMSVLHARTCLKYQWALGSTQAAS